jgi:membrane-associated phospholipid phosphatase/uncharacterized membrane protein (DUF485 family)
MEWEASLIEWLQSTLGSFGTTISKVFSIIGGETVTLLILLVILFCYSKEAGKRCAMSILAASVWFPMIKNIVKRSRPYIDYEDRVKMGILPTDGTTMEQAKDLTAQGYSFPSGHAAMSAALYGTAAGQIRKKWAWILAVVMILMIGCSRFVLGVHYPTDVLVGWALGLFAMWAMALLEKKVPNENVRILILLATALPGIFWCTSHDYFTALGMLIGLAVAVPYEKKYVQFKDTRNIPAMILRVLGALAIYFALNTLMKLPFNKEWLNTGELGANLVRCLRYAIILFVMLGIYPRCFPAFEKLFGKKAD